MTGAMTGSWFLDHLWLVPLLPFLGALAIAAAKSALIAAYFMHLRYERVRLYVGFVLIALATLAVFTGLTMLEVAGR